jgi:hypothetical protein
MYQLGFLRGIFFGGKDDIFSNKPDKAVVAAVEDFEVEGFLGVRLFKGVGVHILTVLISPHSALVSGKWWW